MERVPMTREGYDKKRAELEQRQNVEMRRIEEQIGEARAEGDLSENAEYHGAREAQGLLQAKINVIRDQLARVIFVDASQVPKGEVAFGCTLVVKDLDLDEDEEYTLVGAGEEDYMVGKILVTSPLAKGLMGKKVGEVAVIELPMGTTRYEIVSISHGE